MNTIATDRKRGIIYLYGALWRFAAGARSSLLLALGFLLSAQLIMLAVPYVSGRAINILQLRGAAGLSEAAFWLSSVIGLALISWAMHGPGRIFERNVALHLRQRMSSDLIERLVQLPLSWHESQHSGATVHRVQQSVNSMAGFAENQFIYLNSAVRLVGPVVALWLIEPVIGLVAMVGLVSISFTMTGFDRKMVQLAEEENDAERRYASTLLDSLGNATTLFALRQARAVVALMQQRLLQVFEPVRRSIVINELKWFSVDMANRILSCVLVGLFAWLASRPAGQHAGKPLLLGSIYMVWEYAQQAGGVVSAIAAHFQAFARLQVDYASADAIRAAPPAPYFVGANAAAVNWRQLKLRELTFTHPVNNNNGPSLANVQLHLMRGRRYALIGASGSGKSTLLRLLAGLYAADQVKLTLDTLQFDDCNAVARLLRANSTLIPQDAEVYEGTLAENLSLCESLQGLPQAQGYTRALQVAQADDFVAITESGLNSRIAERGANWSGGQRARIALARGVLAAQGSSLLLLDEPTASLDARTEAQVYDNLFAAFPDACIVSSVHRMNLLMRFDEIILMHDGRLAAQGNIDELNEHSAEFRHLMSAYQRAEFSPS